MEQFDHQSGQYLTIEDASIYYEERGDRNKEALLFLHGGLQNIEDLNTILPFLADQFRIIGMDSRGHGRSTAGKHELTYERLQLDTEALLRYLDIDQVSILGFSDGGIIAYRIAGFNPLKVKKLITVGATWHIRDALLTQDIFLKITPESWKKKFPETYEHYQKLNPEADFDAFIKSVIAMWLDKGPTGYPNEQVSAITCPTLIVRGDEDHLFSRESVVEITGLIKKAALLNIPFAGHVAFEDQPDIFKTVIRQFLCER